MFISYVLSALLFIIGVSLALDARMNTPDPTLDACAKEHNVYACEYVAQPIKSPLLPPPEEGIK